ncbi:MAG: hypothetical protein WD607_02405 [Candidatus Paceibacterota bacterium]
MSISFRYVENLNTQTRSLLTLSQVVKQIGLGKTTNDIVVSKLIKWSSALEQENQDYKSYKGTIANSKNKKLTSKRYIDLCYNLGLINSFNSVLFNTDLGKVLYTLTIDNDPQSPHISSDLKNFFYNLLILKDADLLILSLQILNEIEQESYQKELLRNFKHHYLNRLYAKSKISTGSIKSELQERYRIVKLEWEKAHVYAEHLLIPRLEWLAQLNLVDKIQTSGKTSFKLNKKSDYFLRELTYYTELGIYDIDDNWIDESCQQAYNLVESNSQSWENLSELEQKKILSKYIINVYAFLAKGSAQRIPIIPTLLYSTIMIRRDVQLTVEYAHMKKLLKSEFKYKKRKFMIREAARTNEGYILIKL